MLDNILIVDDDPIALMLFKMVISKADFSKSIQTVKNGKDALLYFDSLKEKNVKSENKQLPQLMFLDLNMPVMGGWDFLNTFNTDKYSEFSSVKVIILSSTIDPADIEKSKTYPMILDFLSKPISKQMLEYIKTIV